mmetsp:Transcript_17282/g.70167  ORF Transcript_17282/g.70167 Transcript_17282/m.70167 type:complete len:222 (+) Transcript_17282:1052-1717(+)
MLPQHVQSKNNVIDHILQHGKCTLEKLVLDLQDSRMNASEYLCRANALCHALEPLVDEPVNTQSSRTVQRYDGGLRTGVNESNRLVPVYLCLDKKHNNLGKRLGVEFNSILKVLFNVLPFNLLSYILLRFCRHFSAFELWCRLRFRIHTLQKLSNRRCISRVNRSLQLGKVACKLFQSRISTKRLQHLIGRWHSRPSTSWMPHCLLLLDENHAVILNIVVL